MGYTTRTKIDLLHANWPKNSVLLARKKRDKKGGGEENKDTIFKLLTPPQTFRRNAQKDRIRFPLLSILEDTITVSHQRDNSLTLLFRRLR